MELPIQTYDADEYLETASGNKVSKDAVLFGTRNIILLGKVIIQPGVIIRGDFNHTRIGRHTVIESNCVIRPSYRKFAKGVAYYALNIGEYCLIEKDSVVNPSSIGSFVHIGKNCVINRRCTLGDCCRIMDNTVLSTETYVPPFAIYSGSPGQKEDREMPECTQDMMIDTCKSYFQKFQPITYDD